jgi:AcrR family transcriptional regulator
MTETALRDRRRRQTEREIGDAALDLFERQGIDHTTVEEIATAAGVSPRTFFRYFTTKERAALVPHVDLEERVEQMIGAMVADRPLLDQLEEIWREVLTAFDDGRSDPGRLVLRVRRLMRAEPGLRLTAMGHDEERLDALVERLRVLRGLDDDLEPRLVAEVSALAVRLALDRWADAHEAGRRVDLLATYAEACALLRHLPR